MKINSLILIFIVILSCQKNEVSEIQPEIKDFTNAKENVFSKIETDKKKELEIQKTKISNSKYYTTLDTIVIHSENNLITKLEKNKFNEIIDLHPEFFDEIIRSPEAMYRNSSSGFSSEAGQDMYYILYAYFLKQRNGIEKNAKHRKKLIEIYSNINSIFSYLQYGGTYLVINNQDF